MSISTGSPEQTSIRSPYLVHYLLFGSVVHDNLPKELSDGKA